MNAICTTPSPAPADERPAAPSTSQDLASGHAGSRELGSEYKTKGSMPQAVVEQLYALRDSEVRLLAAKASISVRDLAPLDRGARFRVATEFFSACDVDAKHALVHDEHAHVRSAASLSSQKL